MAKQQQSSISVKGARVHNLKNVSLDIPRNQLVVITGVSGSGKSSLAFDTLYAEGQRRYVESLSAYARQFLGMMERPDVDSIDGLSPAISIEQKTTSRNPRSTVGTITEVYDYLRLLFARIGQPYCYSCGNPIESQPASAIIEQMEHLPEDTRLQLLAPIARKKKGEFRKELEKAGQDGFVRVRVDGEVYQIEDVPALEKHQKHDIELVVDRLVIRDGVRTRLADSVETALRYGDGMLLALFDGEEHLFSERFACADCGVSFPDIEPRLFSFNSPVGACTTCDGIGTQTVFDPDLIVPNARKSLSDGAIAPWGNRDAFMYVKTIEAVASHFNIDMQQAFESLPDAAKQVLLYGSGKKKVTFVFNSSSQSRVVERPFEGVIPNLQRRYRETASDEVREELEQYINGIDCPGCAGSRLNKTARHVRVGELSLPEVTAMPLREALVWFQGLQLSKQHQAIAEKILEEIEARLGFMIQVGLDYLSLNRTSGTLSGGESQRIRLATQIGSALVGVLYILDEPSIGLHQRDNDRLLETLKRLRDMGNSVIVVEHDEDAIRHADWVIDMGPAAGEHGGEVVGEGTYQDLLLMHTLTADYLSGRKSIAVPKRRPVEQDHPMLEIRGAVEHNLKHVDAAFPLARFCCVTGVSGSGKSTLTLDSLYRGLAKSKGLKTERVGTFDAMLGADALDKVIDIDQSPIGRTPRSNPATYTGVFTPIRDLFSAVPESRARGYKPGRFSFNVKGGRCEACQGDGIIKVEMHFLPDVYVNCESCQGLRYNRETLDVRYKGLNIAEVLALTVDDAVEFFDAIPSLKHRLQTLQEVGLGYIRLGQSATTLSGGEAQRVKLSKELARKATGNTLYILDEPTTGLHFDDVNKLLVVLHALVERGNTVIVIEHNLDVIKTADWLVDMGPEGGDKGGEVIVFGTPETVAQCAGSWTGKYLKAYL
ncbi:MAG: excinuclease ABC subunit UvrA [Zetaproteobacteria bacterium CG_4_9_14_3_um_filter_49_83]|nr:MAG: excinuclease ABC subunit A [Zetaproteobacteria bacterium CG1_02_49_23]PIQ32498.1 MAG: excinuclease ABC subunit A [Zetaproteobacteria bacterium CG17_big_fil_post_rev_8_21_14_2_50_50_13]PIY56838.1 MAG: excinuclease ABC subunit UvrA [Zetaproteobacteria bacterium CG_4_10_14_0_8_um_filter_49_80]PJA34156.1 MAG: excinuclease ABC subunit UvrA [Zetaproteobacteria bacterium CG_4_9_14_3_um_filter_49_83]